MSDHEKVFSYEEGLLAQRRYREWFYQGLGAEQLAYLKLPARKPPTVVADNYLVDWESTMPKRWAEKRACAEADPDVFFPTRTNGYLDPKAPWRRMCPTCPIREACLEFGLEINKDAPGVAGRSGNFGIFGGKLLVKGEEGIVALDESDLKPQGRPRKKKEFPKACPRNKHVLMSAEDVDDNGKCRQCNGDYSIRS